MKQAKVPINTIVGRKIKDVKLSDDNSQIRIYFEDDSILQICWSNMEVLDLKYLDLKVFEVVT